HWNLPAGTLRTADSAVLAPVGRRVGFGRLAAAAAAVAVPAVPVTPKPPDRLRVVATPTARIDARDTVTARAAYAGHLRIPCAVPTVLSRPTPINGPPATIDPSPPRATPRV
ncbi:hypothetical protein VM98_36680, partial [Streptomyces rubellomurinus subsp. indigoferus]